MVSPGKIEPSMRKVTRRSRPKGPVQSVMYRSNHEARFGMLRKMSRVPLRLTTKSLSWCMGRQSRAANLAEDDGRGRHRVGELGQDAPTPTPPWSRVGVVMRPPPHAPRRYPKPV